MKLAVIVLSLFTFFAPLVALAEPSLAETNAAENAAIKKEWESWNTLFKPFRLIGNNHNVGASGISSFLITTPEGHIFWGVPVCPPCRLTIHAPALRPLSW